MNISLNLDKRDLVIGALVLLLLIGGFYHFNSVGKNADKLQQEKNLQKALVDSVHHYMNREKELVSEKLTLQSSTKELKESNLALTASQKELVTRVDEINKHNQIISAALIQMGVKLDGLKNDSPVLETDSTEQFASSPKDSTLSYEILVKNVKRFNPAFKPVLEFTKFSVPNKQFIEFHWKDDKKEGYPISFSVSNTNPYFKVYNLESYAIPELDKKKVKPTFWNKLGAFSKTWGGKAIFFGAGALVGAAVLK
jgi:hypothetical protein